MTLLGNFYDAINVGKEDFVNFAPMAFKRYNVATQADILEKLCEKLVV
jgi:hypothetical protein